jgi:hypothetical protein
MRWRGARRHRLRAHADRRGRGDREGGISTSSPQRAPRRIELLGDEVESLRDFDPASQRSQAELPFFVAPPPREILATREGVIERSGQIRARGLAQGVASRVIDGLLDALLRGALPPGSEAPRRCSSPRSRARSTICRKTRWWWWTTRRPDASA